MMIHPLMTFNEAVILNHSMSLGVVQQAIGHEVHFHEVEQVVYELPVETVAGTVLQERGRGLTNDRDEVGADVEVLGWRDLT